MNLTFRAITESDMPFLQKLYFSTRWEELLPLPWSAEQKEAFLKSQFDAQHAHYQQHFAQASFDVILYQTTPVGRLYLDRRSDEIRVIDIALLPEYRNQGIGSELMRGVLAEATKRKLLVRIHVEQNNPAMRLYQRLGFQKVAEEGIYWLMEWQP